MASLFDIGKSGVESYRQALAVTGQNIANINNDSYKRRAADLQEITATQGGITSIASQAGLGVRVENIRRSFDAYLLGRSNITSAEYQRVDNLLTLMQEVENTLLPSDADLGSQIGRFFSSLQDISAAPGAIPPRQLAVEEGRALADRFVSLSQQLDAIRRGAQTQANDAAGAVNMLATQLAEVNGRLLSSGQSGSAPNSLLDLRDRLISDIAKLSEITVDFSGRGTAHVKLGSTGAGPDLVNATNANSLQLLDRGDNLQLSVISNGTGTSTNQVTKGVVAGAIDAFGFTTEIMREIDYLATVLVQEMNSQHRAGLTMEGQAGGDMFSASGFQLMPGNTNRGDVVSEVTVSDPSALPRQPIELVFREKDNQWVSVTENTEFRSLGAGQYAGAGFTLSLSGAPQNGDSLTLDPVRGAAANMSFLLTRPQDFAATAAQSVMQDVANESDAQLSLRKVTPEAPQSPTSIDAILRNGDSPVYATSFLRDGVVAAIPAGAQNVQLSSFRQQATAGFDVSLSQINEAPSLRLVLSGTGNDGTHDFDLAYATIFPSAGADEGWEDMGEISDALNSGAIRTAGGKSLVDLGLFSSGRGSSLTVSASVGEFLAASQISYGGGNEAARVTAADAASDIHIFTREGRHIAGMPLTTTEITDFLTTANGFSSQASYRAETLNGNNGAYRGMGLSVSNAASQHRVDIGGDGAAPVAIGSTGAVADSATDSYNVAVNLANGRNASFAVPAGASAGFAAGKMNEALAPLGIQALSETRVLLSGFAGSGTFSLNLESANDEPVLIRADITPNNLSGLVEAFNTATPKTGVRAELTAGGDRIVLLQEDGHDMLFSVITSGTPAFDAQLLSRRGDLLGNALNFNDGVSTFDAARFGGTLTLLSRDSFSYNDGNGLVDSAADPFSGGLVTLDNNIDGTIKTVGFNVNGQADGDIADNEQLRASAASGSYSLNLTRTGGLADITASVATGTLPELTAASVSAALANALRGQAPAASMTGQTAIAEANRPVEGDSVRVALDGETYRLTMSDGEIIVSGGEAGRVRAFFDSDGYLQITSGGTLNAAHFSVPDNVTVNGNEDAAQRFGLDTATKRLTGTDITVAGGARTLTLSFGGVAGQLDIAADGTLDTSQLPAGLSVAWSGVNGGQGRLSFTYDDDTGPLTLSASADADALGFKTAGVGLLVKGDKIDIIGQANTPVQITASADSIAEQRITLTDLPNEDLIVLVNGGGARKLSAAYDIAPPVNMPVELDILVSDASGSKIEIIDAATGHSLATRLLDDNGQARYADFEIQLVGQAVENDVFHILDNDGATGDASNINALIALQQANVDGDFSGGFQDIFNSTLTRVGASVRANDVALEAAEAGRDAALEAEMSFTGVNLDAEAAALLEYQQAYQASARVLSTARELFQTLMDVI
ncbi:MAG: flagellar hook-associated protein FlgK [Parvibaculales bacterium]